MRKSGPNHEAVLTVEPEDVLGERLVDDVVALRGGLSVTKVEERHGRGLVVSGREETILEEGVPVEDFALMKIDGEGLGDIDVRMGCAADPRSTNVDAQQAGGEIDGADGFLVGGLRSTGRGRGETFPAPVEVVRFPPGEESVYLVLEASGTESGDTRKLLLR